MYYSTFLLMLLCYTIRTQILFVSGRLKAEGIDAGGELYKQITIRNERLLSKVPPVREPVTVYRNTCGGKITQAPGRIVKEYYFRYIKEEGEKCFWILEAPENYQIYVSYLYYEASLYPYEEEPVKASTYFDAPVLNIYDGSVINESKHLFRIGEATLNNALSTGRHMVIDLAHKKSDTFSFQKLNLQFSFVKTSDLSKVLSTNN